MAAPAWATGLTDLWVAGNGTTNWTALGGGASGLNAETDYYIQSSSCVSKNAFGTGSQDKGMIFNAGTYNVGTDGAVIVWVYFQAAGSLGTRTTPGLRVLAGSGTGAYWEFYVAGSDTLTFDSWIPYAINPDNSLHNATVGTPSGTESFVGAMANIPVAGPTKGSPLGIGPIRHGRCDVQYTGGDAGSGYNTFSGAEGFGNAATRRWGLIELKDGAYIVQGFHSLGLSGTAVDFRDSNKVISFRRSFSHVTSGFNRIEVLNASSNVEWTNIIFQALGTTSKGTFVFTAGTINGTSCQFVNTGAMTFATSSASSMINSIWRGTGQVTIPSTATGAVDLSGGTFSGYEGTTGTGYLVYDLNVDPGTGGELDNLTFTKGTAATHAIRLGTNVPSAITLRGWTVSGYNASDEQNDSVIYNNSGKSVTINIVDNNGTISVRNGAGASTTLVLNPVSHSVHVEDEAGDPISGARVFTWPTDNTGPIPYRESVSIVRSGSTATVTHTGHGLTNNQYVWIQGAAEPEYNGVFQVSVTDANTYTYTVTGTPATPATGSPIATGIIINGVTNASGNISYTRSYSTDQSVQGRVRESTGAPFYRPNTYTSLIDSGTGSSVNVTLLFDE